MVAPSSKFYGKIWVGFCFNVLTLENVFLRGFILKRFCGKRKPLLRKLEYRLLVESTKNENASFLCKTAISESNIKTNKMVTSKWTYQKEQSFAGNCFILFENFKNFL